MRRDANLLRINRIVIFLALCIGVVAVIQVMGADGASWFARHAKSRVFVAPKRRRIANPPNPPAENDREFRKDRLFVVVLDRDGRPGRHFCQMKRQWMEKFAAHDDVEDVVVISEKFWTMDECGVSTLTVPPPKYGTPDTSAWLLYKSFEMFLERSRSGWLFLAGDCVYVKVDEFLRFFKQGRNALSRAVVGGCVEKRYFFQMLVLESGILLDRQTVMKLIEPELADTWHVMFEIGLPYDEALAHAADQVGLYFKGQKFNLFLGREFQNVSHFDALLTKSFTGLKPCIVPDKYLFNGPGDIGVCTPKVTLWSNLLTWSASGILSKTQFLEESERMLYNNPSDLAFFWNGSKPALCNISLGSSDSEPP